jgi:hypothetical protein
MGNRHWLWLAGGSLAAASPHLLCGGRCRKPKQRGEEVSVTNTSIPFDVPDAAVWAASATPGRTD